MPKIAGENRTWRSLFSFFFSNCPGPRARSQPRSSCLSSRQEGGGDSEAHRTLLYKLAMLSKNLTMKNKQEMP